MTTGVARMERFVSFIVGDSGFCAPLSCVLQILRHENLQDAPDARPFVEGALSLRGDIVPVVSLRQRLGLPRLGERDAEAKKRRIMIVQAEGRRFGISVDEVGEVVDLPASALRDLPALAVGLGADLASGFAEVDGALLAILDVNGVLAPGKAPQ